MCAPISEEEMREWRKARAKAAGMAKIKDATIFGTCNIEKIDISYESRSYEQRFLHHVRQRRQRELA